MNLFVYDGNNRLQETDDVGTVEAEYTYLPFAVRGSAQSASRRGVIVLTCVMAFATSGN